MTNNKGLNFDTENIKIQPDQEKPVRKLPKEEDEGDRKAGNWRRCGRHGLYRGPQCPKSPPHE